MPFIKGQSGNPNGRPKEDQELKRLAQQYCPEAIEKLALWMQSDDPRASIPAANSLLDRGYGRPAQNVTVGGDPENPQIIEHRNGADRFIDGIRRIASRGGVGAGTEKLN